MTAEKLHALISTLSEDQKSLVTRYSNAGKKDKKARYLLLFRRMGAHKEWNLEIEEKVRGKEFQKADFYYNTRQLLLEKIISALSNSQQSFPSPDFVWQAIQFDALEMARKAFSKGIKQAFQVSEPTSLLAWYELRNRAERELRVNLELPNGLPSASEVLQGVKVDIQLGQILEQVRELKRLGYEDRLKTSQMLRYRLEAVEPQTPLQEFERSRILSRILLLQGDRERAAENQLRVVNLPGATDQMGQYIQEVAFLSQLLCDVERIDEGQLWAMKLSNLPVASLREERLRQEVWIQNTLILAGRLYSFDLAKKGLESLEILPEAFSPSYISLSFYTGAVIAFANEEFSIARKWLNEVRQIPKKNRPRLTWQPELVRCLLDLEQGFDIESAVRGTRRILKKSPYRYPEALLAIIKVLFKNPHAISSAQTDEWTVELSKLLNDPVELRCSYFFDGLSWIKSKQTGQNMADFLRATRQKDGLSSGSAEMI